MSIKYVKVYTAPDLRFDLTMRNKDLILIKKKCCTSLFVYKISILRHIDDIL